MIDSLTYKYCIVKKVLYSKKKSHAYLHIYKPLLAKNSYIFFSVHKLKNINKNSYTTQLRDIILESEWLCLVQQYRY